MTKGLPRSRGRGPAVRNAVMKMDIPVRNLSLTVVNGAPGYGSAILSGLPQGNLLFLGAVSYLQLSSAAAGVTATFTGSHSVGTVPTVDSDLADAGEADIIPSTTITAAVGKVSSVLRGASTDALGGGIIDNTDGSLELNLNVLIDDAAISADSAFTINGSLHIAYIVLGDD